MFSYPDAHRYRVGPNYFQLPPNRPVNCVYAPYVRDGPATSNGNYGPDPDYVGSELCPVSTSKRVQMPNHEMWSGHVQSFATELDDDRDFWQARELWQIICKEEGAKDQFLHNILPTLTDVPEKLKSQVLGESLRYKFPLRKANKYATDYFGKVHPDLKALMVAGLGK